MKKVLMMLAFVAMVFATGCRKDNPNYEFIGEYRASEMKFDIRLDGFDLQAVTLKDVTLDLKRSGKENVTGTFKYSSVRDNSYSVKGECSGNMVVLDEFAINMERDGLTLDMILNCVGTLNGKTLNLNISYGGTGSLPIGGGAILSGDLDDGVVNVSFTKQGNNNNNNSNHEYVDLGLPSGTLWATCNVGANAPEEYGDYFAWGEIQPQADNAYSWECYKYGNHTSIHYLDSMKVIKYCTNAEYGHNGFTDNLTILQLEDDAAYANWGSQWKTPTKDQWKELMDHTIKTSVMMNGVVGLYLTSTNGNSLFLPAAGIRENYDYYNVYDRANDGPESYYWSGNLNDDGWSQLTAITMSLWFGYETDWELGCFFRSAGLPVRPVRVSH